MAIALTELDFYDLLCDAQEQGEQIYQPLDLGHRINIPQQIGQGSNYTLPLSRGLSIDVINTRLQHPLAVTCQHGHQFPITAKFYLSGGLGSRPHKCRGLSPTMKKSLDVAISITYLI